MFYPEGIYENLYTKIQIQAITWSFMQISLKTTERYIHAWNTNTDFDTQQQMSPTSDGWYSSSINSGEFYFTLDFTGGHISREFHASTESWVKRVTNGAYTNIPLGAPVNASYNIYFKGELT
jgi:hypothetical protein